MGNFPHWLWGTRFAHPPKSSSRMKKYSRSAPGSQKRDMQRRAGPRCAEAGSALPQKREHGEDEEHDNADLRNEGGRSRQAARITWGTMNSRLWRTLLSAGFRFAKVVIRTPRRQAATASSNTSSSPARLAGSSRSTEWSRIKNLGNGEARPQVRPQVEQESGGRKVREGIQCRHEGL